MDAGTDRGTDNARDSTEGGTWLTYGELAEIRGIDRHSAVKLVTRHRWRRQKDNRGILRIFVPPEWAAAKDKGTDQGVDMGTDMSSAVATLQAAITSLTERAERAEIRADAADADRRAAQARADAAEDRVQRVEDRASELRDKIEALQVQLATGEAEGNALTIGCAELTAQLNQARRQAQEARDAAEVLRRAEAARAGQGRWTRVRAAWRR